MLLRRLITKQQRGRSLHFNSKLLLHLTCGTDAGPIYNLTRDVIHNFLLLCLRFSTKYKGVEACKSSVDSHQSLRDTQEPVGKPHETVNIY